MENVETRTSRTAAALLFIVLTMLLAPIGVVVTQVIAQVTGGHNPPRLLVAADPLSDAVAATPAEFRVNESGAATYSVPIFVVPGTAGVAPRLSLNYSSRGGYGPLGRGWSLGGLSAITRCRATREAGDFLGSATPDGSPRPINFTESDRFCLDGQRLVPSTASCPAVSGMVVTVLATEIESFQRVCAYAPASGNNGPAFFSVERKDGSISWYGDRDNNANANRQDGYFESTAPGHTTKALSWAQTRFQDSSGNTIDFIYSKNPAGTGTGEHLISEVRYTGKVKLPGQSAPASNPFAKVVFNYSARPALQWAKGFASGGVLTQSRRLDSITSCSTIDCAVHSQARHYALNYQVSASGSGQEILSSLRECRDSRTEVCASPTNFEWSSAKHELATQENQSSLPFGASQFIGIKLGDINGDGRADLVHLRGASCGSLHGCHRQFTWAIGSTGSGGSPAFINAGSITIPSFLGSLFGEGFWHLLDYNGDGRDDLLLNDYMAGTWKLFLSNGNGFDSGQNQIANLAIPSTLSKDDQLQVVDLNGDGLTDIVYPRNGALYARLMERSGGVYAWGTERGIVMNTASLGPIAQDCDNGSTTCSRTISGIPTAKTSFLQLADFNGDAASDLLIRVNTQIRRYLGGTPGCSIIPLNRSNQTVPEWEILPYVPESGENLQATAAQHDPCWEDISVSNLHAFVVQELTPTAVGMANYGSVSSGSPNSLMYADINADGLTDLFVQEVDEGDWSPLINTGAGFQFQPALQIQNYRNQARFNDLNGDGRTDVAVLVNMGGYKAYQARYALPSGGFSSLSPIQGGNARICQGSGCDERTWLPIFADLDGDGHTDFASMKLDDNPNAYFSRSNQRFTQKDVVVRITNGLGEKTELSYAPLTNAAVYRRVGTSRNGLNWGRGSPVSDLITPMYVVAQAANSSPQVGNPDAMASVHYRYSNARVQAGGRGFLGFGIIEAIDPNQNGGHIVTSTSYFQNFPFTGASMRTVQKAISGAFSVPACLTGVINNTCFAFPNQAHHDLGGNWFSDIQQSWEVSPSSLASRVPLHVRVMGKEESQRDPFTGALTSKALTAFLYDSTGNVAQTSVDTFTGSSSAPTATVLTQNSYANDFSKWRLGRLTASTVTHSRAGQTSVTRTNGFSYQMNGTTTGLLTEEHLQPGAAANLASTKSYQLDDYGNRMQTTTCAGLSTPCSTSGMLFQPTVTTHIRRYARVAYDMQGRFPIATYEPFWSDAGGEERRTSYVAGRNVFGDATDILDVNNVRTYAVTGMLGRQYYSWQQTTEGGSPYNSGVRSLTTYRTCSQVDCPAGAAFRQQVETTAAPRQWTYLDVLGRLVMHAGETFNVGVSGKDVSAVCTDYDAVGRPKRVSNPFFLAGTAGANGPTGLAAVCTAGARQWTVTTYDVLGRPVLVQAPDASQASVGYTGLMTTKTDPRGNAIIETRNGLGEVTAVTDARGLTVTYAFDAAGNITSVNRNAGSGVIANTFAYDVLGRKVQQNDPDTGLTSFEYNALGELTARVDALGNRTEHSIDARGRIWRTTAKDFNGLTESESIFTFDTAMMGSNYIGQLTRETITGTYVGWSGQPNTALSFDREHYFDAMGRPAGNTVQMDNQVFGASVQYDALGRAQRVMDASGQSVKTEYGPRGHALALCATDLMNDATWACAGADTYQRTLETDAWGNVARERRGNSAALEVARTVWADTGRVASICAGNSGCNLINEQYGWDAAGNLSSHLKEQRYLETFTYDELNRLATGTLVMRDGVTVNQSTVSIGYDALGNICSRNGTGYGYGASAGCSGSSGMAAMPVAAAMPSSRMQPSPAMRTAFGRQEQQAEPRALRNAVAWHVPAAWRDRFVHHAPERSRSRDDDRASFMDDSEDLGLAHGFVSGTGTRIVSRSRSNATATSSTARASAMGSFMVSPMSAGSGGPHAVNQTVNGSNTFTYAYDHRGNQVSRTAPTGAQYRTIVYSLDDKAHEIRMGTGQRVRFWYGPDGQRYKREEAGKTTYYVGGVEVIVQGGATTFKRYLGGIALQTVVGSIIQTTQYLFHDQLGSLVRIANADGSVAERLDYQAFGGRRNPSDPHATGAASTNTPRGYTGHEFVDGTGVIHMNGRIYDSELGRFLQADPIIQAPRNTQNWNAYTYVFNNPFKYTDPTGEFAWFAGLVQALGTVTVTGVAGVTMAQVAVAVAAVSATAYMAAQGAAGANGVGGAYSGGTTSDSGNAGPGRTGSAGRRTTGSVELPEDGVAIIGPVTELPKGGYAFKYLNVQGEVILSVDLIGGATIVPSAAEVTAGAAVAGGAGGLLDGVQTTLDVAGFLPGIGTAADLVNAGIHLYRGNYAMAAMAGLYAIPLAGDAIAAGVKGARVANGAKKASVSKASNGYGVNDAPARIQGPWTEADYLTALQGKPPASLGRPDLHHAGQMPGSAVHEIPSIQHRGNSTLHPNKYNQGVTAEMRMQDRQLHWWYRAREQGADHLYPELIYD